MNLYTSRIRKATHRLSVCLLISALTIPLTGSRTATIYETVLRDNVLRMITFVGPTTYFENARGPNGFEYFLGRAFARSLGVQLEVTVIEDLNALINALGGPRAHFAGAGLTVTESRQALLHFSQPYLQVRQTLLYRQATPRPRDISDTIGGRLVVVANSSHEELLTLLQKDYPGLRWEALRDTEMMDLVRLVHEGEADYALVDSSAYSIDRGLYPRAQSAFYLTEPEPVAWAFPGHGDDSLVHAANRFLTDYRDSGKLEQLKARFYGHTDEFSVGGSQLFMHRIDERLKQYISVFKEAATQWDLDWHLLAAMAYQESHWNPKAKSPTGVRGMMMLTRQTANSLKIRNRLNAEHSIRGGAEYFAKTRKRIPPDITEPDRTWFALAAYNVGMGHLEDARVLTENAGDDPHLWAHVRRHLPKLAQKKYYRTVKHGFARGNEPVQYVQNIRHFATILQWHSMQQRRQRALLENQLPELGNSLVLPL